MNVNQASGLFDRPGTTVCGVEGDRLSGRGGAARALRLVVVFCFAALALVSVVAADDETAADDLPTHVTPPAAPTDVSVGAYLIGLSRISEPSEPFPTFEVEVFLNLSWHDPRLSFEDTSGALHVFLEEEAEEKLSEIWSPDIEVENEVEQR